jgi:hypothetical protein
MRAPAQSDLFRTVVVDGPLALRVARLKAAREGAVGHQIVSLPKLATRLAGGFVRPAQREELEPALADHFVTQRAKGGVLHAMGQYREAIVCLNRCERMEPERWAEALGPLIRADCHARLGNEAAALADCDTLSDDHWTPGMFSLPAGNKQEVAAELSQRAAAARAQQRG